ncbi:hypothetical protein BU25DRAFT_485578 [Macroventuria anomochaeta]|uniref:Uncharacterized protein n=1 Tax=Macroventuria anomochaeta TaxID=301207 RepID=A0ACB6S6F2_9PLEO|nr:uncharacterized protein BU25DRAFT_485578 [Macroventuria anomochaeta]KAF2629613.1 hypothetical protein BU25DRAFT_485578 [Macroventuria anomochaeta]
MTSSLLHWEYSLRNGSLDWQQFEQDKNAGIEALQKKLNDTRVELDTVQEQLGATKAKLRDYKHDPSDSQNAAATHDSAQQPAHPAPCLRSRDDLCGDENFMRDLTTGTFTNKINGYIFAHGHTTCPGFNWTNENTSPAESFPASNGKGA